MNAGHWAWRHARVLRLITRQNNVIFTCTNGLQQLLAVEYTGQTGKKKQIRIDKAESSRLFSALNHPRNMIEFIRLTA